MPNRRIICHTAELKTPWWRHLGPGSSTPFKWPIILVVDRHAIHSLPWHTSWSRFVQRKDMFVRTHYLLWHCSGLQSAGKYKWASLYHEYLPTGDKVRSKQGLHPLCKFYIQCEIIQCDAIQYNAAECNTIEYNYFAGDEENFIHCFEK